MLVSKKMRPRFCTARSSANTMAENGKALPAKESQPHLSEDILRTDPIPWGIRALTTGKSALRDLKLVSTINDHFEEHS